MLRAGMYPKVMLHFIIKTKNRDINEPRLIHKDQCIFCLENMLKVWNDARSKENPQSQSN